MHTDDDIAAMASDLEKLARDLSKRSTSTAHRNACDAICVAARALTNAVDTRFAARIEQEAAARIRIVELTGRLEALCNALEWPSYDVPGAVNEAVELQAHTVELENQIEKVCRILEIESVSHADSAVQALRLHAQGASDYAANLQQLATDRLKELAQAHTALETTSADLKAADATAKALLEQLNVATDEIKARDDTISLMLKNVEETVIEQNERMGEYLQTIAQLRVDASTFNSRLEHSEQARQAANEQADALSGEIVRLRQLLADEKERAEALSTANAALTRNLSLDDILGKVVWERTAFGLSMLVFKPSPPAPLSSATFD